MYKYKLNATLSSKDNVNQWNLKRLTIPMRW